MEAAMVLTSDGLTLRVQDAPAGQLWNVDTNP
jgi:hypothetical protein